MATTIYVIQANSDQNEGRGHAVDVAAFTDKDVAVQVNDDPRFCAEYGIMGSHTDAARSVVARVLYGSAEEFFEQLQAKKNSR